MEKMWEQRTTTKIAETQGPGCRSDSQVSCAQPKGEDTTALRSPIHGFGTWCGVLEWVTLEMCLSLENLPWCKKESWSLAPGVSVSSSSSMPSVDLPFQFRFLCSSRCFSTEWGTAPTALCGQDSPPFTARNRSDGVSGSTLLILSSPSCIPVSSQHLWALS